MTEHDDRRAREAFDGLRRDAERVDTMEALQRVQSTAGLATNPRVLALAAATIVLIAAIAGGLLLSNRDDGSTVIADDPDAIEQPNKPATDGSTDLAGTPWRFVRGTGPDGAIPLVDGWPITLTFDEDTFGGTAACNGYGGSYTFDGSAITLSELGWTEMGCDGSVMESEAAFLESLQLVGSAELADDQLLLTADGVELTFAPETPVPTAELVGQLWLLDTLIQGEAASSVQGDPALLLLDADGNVSGGTGCRTFTGSYIVNGGSVLFPDFAMEGDCVAQLSEQDNLVVTVLGDGFTPTIDGERLTLTSAGNEGLSYRAITDDEVEPAEGVDPFPGPLSAADLQGDVVEGEVTLRAFLVDTGGGWYLCDQPDTSLFNRCSGAWIPVVHLDEEIITQFGPNELSDDLGSWRQSEEPVLLRGHMLEDGRFEVDGSSVSNEPTDDDVALVASFLELDQRRPDVESLPLAPSGVVMSLGIAELREQTTAQLADPANWAFESEGFRGRTGTFSALDVLANADETEIFVGTHNHCASPPAAVPEVLREARPLSIQPTGIDSCINWWTVGIYLDDAGDVIGIVFDTWEP